MARLNSVLAYGSRQLKRAFRKWQMASLASANGRVEADVAMDEQTAETDVLYWAACEGFYERAWHDMASYRAQYQRKANWHGGLSWATVEA